MKQTTPRILLLVAAVLALLMAGLVGHAAHAQAATLSSDALHRRNGPSTSKHAVMSPTCHRVNPVGTIS
jgi:hypothetical protein